MNKDQSYGGLIFVVSVLIAIGYLIGLYNPGYREWLIGVPVVLAVIGILGITAWIGYTMLTTPPPAPLESDIGPPSQSSTSESKSEDKKP